MGRNLSYETVKHFIEVESDSGCKLISEKYFRNDQNLKIQCRCGNIFLATYANFVYNYKRQCNECGLKTKIKKFSKTYDEIKNIIEVELKDWKELRLLSTEYINSRTKLILEDSQGYKYYLAYETLRSNYKYKNELDKFNKYNPFTIDNIRLWLKLNNINYELLSDNYISAHETNLVWKCLNGHIFNMSWNNFKNGKRCRQCKDSKGERVIKEFLIENNIPFEQEFIIKECKNKKYLPFDFAIFYDKEKTKLRLLIEYDGEQHFRKTGWENENDKKLLRTQINDVIRNNYCLTNNIPLLRIPYWEFNNIENILTSNLKGGESG